jgi:RNA polymerase sigma-70 factor (ECF subfamily)
VTFEELYRGHVREVTRFAFYLSGDAVEAEDIASETFVRAWAAEAPARARSLRAYLFAIARNLHRRRHALALRERPLDEAAEAEGGDLEAELAGRSELVGVIALLQALPEVDRAALLMRAFHALPYEEIAAALEISLSSAKVKVHRARARLARTREIP